MTIKIEDLEKIILLMLSNIKKSLGDYNEIYFHNDLYWDLFQEDIFNVYSEPNKPTIGSLSDDMYAVLRLLKNDDMIAYDLKRISSIIRAISIEKSTLI